MQLTTAQVSLIAAAIALAVLGRIAAYVSEPATRPNPFEAIAGDQWRRFAAQVEAFASTQVIALRDSLPPCVGGSGYVIATTTLALAWPCSR